VYKELQKIKFPSLRPRKISISQSVDRVSRTFAEVAESNLNPRELNHDLLLHGNDQRRGQNRPQVNNTKKMQETLQNLIKQMTAITNTLAELVTEIAQLLLH